MSLYKLQNRNIHFTDLDTSLMQHFHMVQGLLEVTFPNHLRLLHPNPKLHINTAVVLVPGSFTISG